MSLEISRSNRKLPKIAKTKIVVLRQDSAGRSKSGFFGHILIYNNLQ